MAWPILTQNDVQTLCTPFAKPMEFKKSNYFNGFVFFDVGSVLLDLDWESFFQGFCDLFKPEDRFSLDKFRKKVREDKLTSQWSVGKISAYNFASKIKQHLLASCVHKTKTDITIHDIKYADSLVVGNLRPSIIKLAKKLQKNNFGIGILSNTTPWHAYLIHEKILSQLHFDVVIFSNDVGCEKPDKEIYEISAHDAKKFVKLKYQQTLHEKDIYFIDDTPANIQTATTLGWNARLVNLVKDDLLLKLQNNEINDSEFQFFSQNRENLLFAEAASKRVEDLFGNWFYE